MRVADCFPPFDVGVEAVAVFGFYTEYPVQQRGKLNERIRRDEEAELKRR